MAVGYIFSVKKGRAVMLRLLDTLREGRVEIKVGGFYSLLSRKIRKAVHSLNKGTIVERISTTSWGLTAKRSCGASPLAPVSFYNYGSLPQTTTISLKYIDKFIIICYNMGVNQRKVGNENDTRRKTYSKCIYGSFNDRF